MADPLPRYYAVDGRPVKLVAAPAGGTEALAVDAATGGLFPDSGFLGRVGAPVTAACAGEDVVRLTEDAFARLVAGCRRPISYRRAPAGTAPFRGQGKPDTHLSQW